MRLLDRELPDPRALHAPAEDRLPTGAVGTDQEECVWSCYQSSHVVARSSRRNPRHRAPGEFLQGQDHVQVRAISARSLHLHASPVGRREIPRAAIGILGVPCRGPSDSWTSWAAEGDSTRLGQQIRDSGLGDGPLRVPGLTDHRRSRHGEDDAGEVRRHTPLHARRAPGVDEGDPASPELVSDNRSLIGALSWMSAQTRPDLTCSVSMAQQLQKAPTYGDLKFTNGIAGKAHQFKDRGLEFRSIPQGRLMVIVFHDAAWANVPEPDSEEKYYVLTPEEDELGLQRDRRSTAEGQKGQLKGRLPTRDLGHVRGPRCSFRATRGLQHRRLSIPRRTEGVPQHIWC